MAETSQDYIDRKIQNTWRATVGVLGFLVTISMAVTGWTVSRTLEAHVMISSLDKRVTVIEHTRFTAKEISTRDKALAELAQVVAILAQKMDSHLESNIHHDFRRRIERKQKE